MSSALQSRIEVGRQAVLAQTELLHREFGRVASQWKSDGTRVTSADLAISEGILRTIGAAFPADVVLSEELTNSVGPIAVESEFSWVLDPIDGTNNFATGIAHCAIALALLQHGMPVYGFVYDLSRRVLIQGGPGYGLFDGDRPARVNQTPANPQSLVGFHSPYDKAFGAQARLLVENFKIRALGSSTLHLAYTAIGILDATVDHNVKIWDIAAAVPLVLAGGGAVEFINGEQFPLRSFDLKMKRIQYLAGSADNVRAIRELLGA
ncbi:MAG: inositol monophosphatase [Opitutaceae bacterium]|nr:inositol monophosphatase [Opitutaceae bacterium]